MEKRRDEIISKGFEPKKPFGVDKEFVIKIMSEHNDKKIEKQLMKSVGFEPGNLQKTL